MKYFQQNLQPLLLIPTDSTISGKMRIYIVSYLFLITNSAFGFTLEQVMERVDYIEDRVNKESKFRRDGFKTLINEIGSLKTMLQQVLENKIEVKDTETVQDTKNTRSDLEQKFLLLTNAFMKEKILNKRFRREIPELQRQVQDLKSRSDQIFKGVEETLSGIEFIKNQNRERQETFIMLEDEIPKIKGYSLNLLEQFENTEITEAENFSKIKNDTKEIKKNIEHLKDNQELCLENININNNLTKRPEELVSGKVFVSKENDSVTTDHHERECNCSVSSCPVNSTPSPDDPMASYKSCLELYDSGFKSNAIYKIEIEKERNISVYCDMTTDGGGWTVFQRRQDGSVDFFRYWNEYETGFGNLTGEFWLGNKFLNLLTDNDEPHELRIDLEDHDGNRAYAKYSSFKVGSRKTNYKLEVSGYTGNAGDSLAESDSSYGPHDQMEFTTRDADNDKASSNCASLWEGAWWFKACYDSHLNGLYQDQSKCKSEWDCIIWNTWKGSYYALKFTEMKFR
ncbi:fibroleukin-like [Mercenaria mercenaria]|uniref:fibroleukin-like n=1 Tax=Mercenaria mercenaria TaxID=6596 RepID=UPI00234F58D4|nr:fibroleukin-like [Mercenaria mercenaria]